MNTTAALCRLRFTLAGAALCAVTASSGCIIGADGRPLGGQSLDALVEKLNGRQPCTCQRHHCGAHGHECITASCEDSPAAYLVDGDDDDYLPEGDCDVAAPPYDACSEVVPLPEYGEDVCGPPDGSGAVGGVPRCRVYDPEAGIFNFCVPPAALGAPAPPPPGRFFPVPTRPVFAPREIPIYAAAP